MKNPLTFPLLILMASLALLVVAILRTPEVEVVQHPTFENLVGSPRDGSASPQMEPESAAPTPLPETGTPNSEAVVSTPEAEILAADAP